MAKNPLIPKEELQREIDSAVRTAARQLGEEIANAYRKAIKDFYGAYTPRSYDRTLSLRYGMMGINGGDPLKGGAAGFAKPLASFKGGSSGQHMISAYQAGIYVDPMFIEGDPYWKSPPHGKQFPKAEIFERSFASGIHGFTRKEVITHNHEVDRINKPLGRKKKGRVPLWRPGEAPKKSGPPINILSKKFNEISNKKHIQELLMNALGL